MNKLLSVLLAGAAALAFSGAAISADNTNPPRDSGKDVQNQVPGEPVQGAGKDVGAEGRDSANQGAATGTVDEGGKDVATEGRDPKKEEFQADMKKCDSMTGATKKSCVDAAKKKHGQM